MLFDLRIWLARKIENAWIWVAWSLPHTLVKWAAIRLVAHATQGKYGNTHVVELTAMDALKRWDDPAGGDRTYGQPMSLKRWMPGCGVECTEAYHPSKESQDAHDVPVLTTVLAVFPSRYYLL